MSRLLVILITIVSIDCAVAQAQWFGRRSIGARLSRVPAHTVPNIPNRYHTPYPTTTGRMSVGMLSYPDYNYPRPGTFDPYRFDNYVYDPYRYGSFRAPDLLEDPYFRERYRYDSHFPGRRNQVKALRPAMPELAYPTPRNPYLYQGDKESLRAPSLSDSQLRSAPDQLAHSLSFRDDGQAWMEFLAPRRILQLIEDGNDAELRDLLTRYDGITNSPALKPIMTARGFEATRQLIRQHVGPAQEPMPDGLNAPSGEPEEFELLPVPQID